MSNDVLDSMDGPRPTRLTTICVLQRAFPEATRDQILLAIRRLEIVPAAIAGRHHVFSPDQVERIGAELQRVAGRRNGVTL